MHSDPLNPEPRTLNPRKPGRPRALDEIKRREILATIHAGFGLETAAHYAGVSPRTVHRELRRNKQFWDQYRKAELNARIEPLDTMARAVKESWRAAAWMLERKSPRDFAKVHPRMIDPLDLEAAMGQIYDAVFRSIRDPLLRRKVARNIEKSLKTELHELETERRSPRPPKRKKERPFYPDPFFDTEGDNDDEPPRRLGEVRGEGAGSPHSRWTPPAAAATSNSPTLHAIWPASASEISSVSIPNSIFPTPLFDLPAPNTFEDAPDMQEPLSPTPNSEFPTPNSTAFCPKTSGNIPLTATPSPAAISVPQAALDTL
jgi:hypothetical protein